MKVLIADDDPVSRQVLEGAVQRWGYLAIHAETGPEALAELRRYEPPDIAILDWQMPGMDGPDICRAVRSEVRLASIYILLLTARANTGDIVQGLESGADDYIVKPFNHDELRARLQVGARVVQLQRALADRVRQLEEAADRERKLMGLLPICAYCKQIRDDEQHWQPVELYLAGRSEVRFSHSICPDCAKRVERELGLA